VISLPEHEIPAMTGPSPGPCDNDKAEEVDLRGIELAFFKLDVKAMLMELLENFANMLNMLFEGVRVDKNVIQVTNGKYIKEVLDTGINIRLEGNRCIC
jgi:hypothetical protein